MKPARIKCPSCGAGHDISNPGVITIVCEYCGTAVYWDEEKIKNAIQKNTATLKKRQVSEVKTDTSDRDKVYIRRAGPKSMFPTNFSRYLFWKY